jgi:magnesium-protoporphyrin IX monomethyl ester (oxidative) cyclase
MPRQIHAKKGKDIFSEASGMTLIQKYSDCAEPAVQSKKESHHEHDVLFAYMPYHRLTHPALGASILKTCLQEAGVSTRIAYLGLDFATRIGTTLYNALLNSRTPLLQAEWTFAQAAFGPDFHAERRRDVGRPYPWTTRDIRKAAVEAELWINDVVESICENPPKILICSSMFQQNLASLAVLRGVKERCSDVVTIMGGPNTEGILGIGLLRRAGWLDYVCAGEGEVTLPALCMGILSQSQPSQLPVGVIGQQDLSRYAGLVDSKVPRPSVSDMNQSPAPCFDDFFEAIAKSPVGIEPGLLLESSRGCWWGQRSHCTFCGLNGDGMAYRYRDPQAMASIVRSTTSRYNTKKIEFVDNIIAKSYFEEFLPLLENEDLTLFYETKADFNESEVQRFYTSGVRFIQPGIESLSDPVLKLMRKGTSAALNLECLRLCREYGINPAWSILSGFPREEAEWYEETLVLLPKLFHLRPPNGFIPIRYDRFSPYHDHPERWDLELEPFEAYRHLYPPYEGQHDDVAYFFKRRGRDELEDDGLSIWSKTHRECREIVGVWKKFWADRVEAKLEQPQLLLVYNEGWMIRDDRNPNEPMKETYVSGAMNCLLRHCRERRSKSLLQRVIKKDGPICLEGELQLLLDEAMEQGWIVRISGQWISLVQKYNHQQLSQSEWPGGRLLPT